MPSFLLTAAEFTGKIAKIGRTGKNKMRAISRTTLLKGVCRQARRLDVGSCAGLCAGCISKGTNHTIWEDLGFVGKTGGVL